MYSILPTTTTQTNMTDCTICLCKNGKIYRELGCGHRFHHKCLSLCHTKTCPLCRTPYENIVLRERVLSSSDLLKLKIYCNDIKSLINSITTSQPSERLHIINTILKYLIDNKNMVNSKFPVKPLIEVIKQRIYVWNSEIVDDVNINKQYITQFNSYSKHLLKAFQKAFF